VNRWVSAVPRSLTRQRETGWAFAIGAAAVYVAFLCWAGSLHEFWRDEIHPWALARTAQSFWDIATGDRVYDGHPPLWYWYLRVWSWVTTRPWGLHAANIAAMGLAGLLFLRFAPFARPLKILLLGSYFLGYEYGVLARNYTMTWLMLAAFCSAFNPLRPRLIWLSFFLALAVITSVYGALMVCGLVLVLVPLGMSIRLSATLPRDLVVALRPRFAIGLGIVLLSFVFFVYSTAPPDPNPYSPRWNFGALNSTPIQLSLSWIVQAFLPIRVFGDANYWGNQLQFWGEHPMLLNAVGVALFLLMVLALAPGWWEVAAFAVGVLLLSVFGVVRYTGGMRQIGNLFLLFVALAWLRRLRAPRGRHLLSTVMLVVIGLFQARTLLVAVKQDRIDVFSGSGAAAAFIEKVGLQDLPIVAGPDAIVLAVTAHLHRPFISSETEDIGETMVFHSRRRAYSDGALLDRAVRYTREKHTPVLVLSDHPLPPPAAPGMPWKELYSGPPVMESFSIYELGP
jgi:hypothetical protein